MRLTKSLLCGISALLLGAGTAFAGQDSTMENSVENSFPELMADESQSFAESEGDVIYVYPIEVTEYYLIIPSESSEMPG